MHSSFILRQWLLASCLLLAQAHVAAAAPQELAGISANPASPSSKLGKPDFSIAAVVGDEAISSYDVENRIKFIIATARISNTPDVLKVIRPQVIRSLVDEKLQVQEAKKNNIEVTPKDLNDAIEAIEQERGMPKGTIEGMLVSSNVPKEAFQNQIRAQLMWNKLLGRKVRPNVHISDEELQQATRKYSMTPPKKKEAVAVPQEYKIALIALPVEKASQENAMKNFGLQAGATSAFWRKF